MCKWASSEIMCVSSSQIRHRHDDGNAKTPSFFADCDPGHRSARLPLGAVARRDRPGSGVCVSQRFRRRSRSNAALQASRRHAAGWSVTASAGVELAAVALPPTGAPRDTLMIAGGQGVEAAAADPALVDWVRQRAKDARRVASVCSGAFPPYASSPIRSSCATVRSGHPRA
jgi:hypothetical protein